VAVRVATETAVAVEEAEAMAVEARLPAGISFPSPVRPTHIHPLKKKRAGEFPSVSLLVLDMHPFRKEMRSWFATFF